MKTVKRTDFGARMHKARTDRGLSQREAAKRLGMSQSTLSELESTAQGTTKIIEFATLYRCDAQWLSTGIESNVVGRSEPRSTTQPAGAEALAISTVDIVTFRVEKDAPGFVIEYLNDAEIGWPMPPKWFDERRLDPKSIYATRIRSQNMEPRYGVGDIVIVNTEQTTPKDGATFVVNYEGDAVVARLTRDAGQWWLCSDNPDKNRFPRKIFHSGVKIIGEIVAMFSERG